MVVEDLVKVKESSSSVAFQKFVLLSAHAPDDLFCFFEGKDAPYYHIRIKSNFKGEPQYIRCNGKKMVLKVYSLIKGKKLYNRYKTAYFIDRDFDESIKDKVKGIYETPCYSIENLYCSTRALKELLKCEFSLSAQSNEFKEIVRLYDQLLEKFLEATVLFNAWYCLQKQEFEIKSEGKKVYLEPVFPKEFVSFTLDGIQVKYDLEGINRKFSNAAIIQEKKIKALVKSLKKMDLLLTLRGKYVFSFLLRFIQLILEDSRQVGKSKYLLKKVKYNIDSNNALSLLTNFADTPECLLGFIKSYN